MHRALALILLLSAGAPSARADVYVDVVELHADDFAYGDYASAGLRTVQLWVAGLDTDASLRAVFGRPLLPLTIETTDPTGFHNSTELGQTHFAPAEGLFPAFPELQWDTFVTIGRSADTIVSAGFPDTALEGGGTNLFDAHVMWWDFYPGTPETEVDGRVLFGQFSFGADYALNVAEMRINVTVADALGTPHEIWNVPIVPAPGAAVALLLFVTVGRRARRAARS